MPHNFQNIFILVGNKGFKRNFFCPLTWEINLEVAFYFPRNNGQLCYQARLLLVKMTHGLVITSGLGGL